MTPNTWSCNADGGGGSGNVGAHTVSSRHAGGVNTLMGDGSVRFIKDTIAKETWWALGTKAGAKSLILFFLEGGPAHQDLWDMKPDAPEAIRGEFRPIATTVPGLQFCEHLPLLAQQAHHLTPRPLGPPHDRRPQRRGLLRADRPRPARPAAG